MRSKPGRFPRAVRRWRSFVSSSCISFILPNGVLTPRGGIERTLLPLLFLPLCHLVEVDPGGGQPADLLPGVAERPEVQDAVLCVAVRAGQGLLLRHEVVAAEVDRLPAWDRVVL